MQCQEARTETVRLSGLVSSKVVFRCTGRSAGHVKRTGVYHEGIPGTQYTHYCAAHLFQRQEQAAYVETLDQLKET